MRQTILRLNGTFLLVVGLAQAIFELLSHFLGLGPLGTRFVDSAYTIGFFEAHGLAVLIGLLLLRAAVVRPDRFWHAFAVVVHLLLGGANLLFWSSFVELDFVGPGLVATVFDGIFLVAESYWYRQAGQVKQAIDQR
jgi:hypothetical protein